MQKDCTFSLSFRLVTYEVRSLLKNFEHGLDKNALHDYISDISMNRYPTYPIHSD